MATIKSTTRPIGERLLAAIMFTDVVNYSGQTATDEERTLAAVNRDFKVMSECIARHRGQLLKTLGDGMLAHFRTAINAVGCAQEIQSALAAGAHIQTGEKVLKHRIGIHIGDVFVTENDVGGHGVNIAARLQTCAEPGGICISQTVFDVVKHQLVLRVNYLGPQELKHIGDSVAAYQVLGVMPSRARVEVRPEPRPQSPAPALSLTFAPPSTLPMLREQEGHFSIVVLGDFSGRGSRESTVSANALKPRLVDWDNFAEVLRTHAVHLRLPTPNHPEASLDLRFGSLDDFHPDRVIQQVPVLNQMWNLRRRLLNPTTARSAREELSTMIALPREISTQAVPGISTESHDQLVARLLGKAPADAPSQNSGSIVQQIIHRAMGNSAVQRDSTDTDTIAKLELELTHQLRSILQHPSFQALESAWRGVEFLIQGCGTEPTVKLYLLDISADELVQELSRSRSPEKTTIAQSLARCSASMILGNFTFGQSEYDIDLLAGLGGVAASLGAPIIANASPYLVGCTSFAQQPDPDDWGSSLPSDLAASWETLRSSEAAKWIALVAPRFLLRLPYGVGGDTIDSFPFEELSESLPHESYLWGNGAFACSRFLAQTFVENRSALADGPGELFDLPMHCVKRDGEVLVKSIAESWLTTRAGEKLAASGLMSLLPIKGQAALRIQGFHTISRKPTQLPLRQD